MRKWKPNDILRITKKKYVWKRCQFGLTRDRIGDFIAVMKGEQYWELYKVTSSKAKKKAQGEWSQELQNSQRWTIWEITALTFCDLTITMVLRTVG